MSGLPHHMAIPDHFLVCYVTERSTAQHVDSTDQFLVFSATARSAPPGDSSDHFLFFQHFHGRPRWIPATVGKAVGPVSFMVQTTAGLVWKQHLDHIRTRMETSLVAVEPADEGGDEEPVPGTTSSTVVESDTSNPNTAPTVEMESQEIGSSAELRPSVMRRYPSRDPHPLDRFNFDS